MYNSSLCSAIEQATIVPHVGCTIYGQLSVGIKLLNAGMRLEGDLVTTELPTTADIGFNQFPLDVK